VGKAILKRRGCNHAIRNAQRLTGGLPLPVKYTPALGNSLRYGKHTPPKPERDSDFNKFLELRPLRALSKKGCAPSQLADGHHADELNVFALAP
jgi:hypothetical protein